MAGSISGAITFQGLGSGTDFASMITELKKVEAIPQQRMLVWKAEWDTRVTAFQEIMTTMQEVRNALGSFSSLDQLLKRTVDSSASTVATATADSRIENGIYSIDVQQLATSAILSNLQIFSGKDAVVNATGTDATFEYTYNGTTRSITVSNGTTLEQLVAKINNDPQNPGVRAGLIKSGSGYVFQLQGKETGAAAALALTGSTDLPDFTPGSANWYERPAQDAEFTVNGWGQTLTSSTNTLTEVIEGLTITLKDTGSTNFAVEDDTESLKENIRSIVESINQLRGKIRDLTKLDESKQVSSPETDESTGVIKLASQFTWQKGSVLTGNYGVQLLASRFSDITARRASGFVPRADATDFSNDLFSSLAQIGISTVSDESDPEFGLLRIDEAKLDEALAADIRNVAELFSADREPSTHSTDFSVVSAGTVAKAGTYGVTYKVDAAGTAYDVYINGAPASTDPAFPGRWTVGDMNNPAAGVSIQFADGTLTPDAAGKTGDFRIKSGKVNELISQLDAELQPVVEGSMDVAGAIPLLIDNYKEVIENIQTKITRETERLVLWEKRMKAKFSRLDSTLARYNQQMESNASALAQLSSDS
jgi:flagellar hook-associated protein 2